MKKSPPGFSLVEVTIALGIIAFCVISVFGLLPSGMRSVKEANDRRNAVEIMNTVAGDLLSRSSWSTNPNHLSGVFTNIRVDQAAEPILTLTEDGQQTGDLKYKMRVAITPPTPEKSGVAKLSVVWPAAASYVGTNSPSGWTNAQGVVKTVIFFNQ